MDAAFKAGWRRCKLYFMIGLPTETDDDIKGIASLAQRAYDRMKAATPPEQRGSLRMSVSCALFGAHDRQHAQRRGAFGGYGIGSFAARAQQHVGT